MQHSARKYQRPLLSGPEFLCKLTERCCILNESEPCPVEAAKLLSGLLCDKQDCGILIATDLQKGKRIGTITYETITIAVVDSGLRRKDIQALQEYRDFMQSGGRACLIVATDFEDDPLEASWADRRFGRDDLVSVLNLLDLSERLPELNQQAQYYRTLETSASAWRTSPMDHWGTCAWNGFFRHCARSPFLETARNEGLAAERTAAGSSFYPRTKCLRTTMASRTADSMPERISESTSEIILEIREREIVISLLTGKGLCEEFDEEAIASDASIVKRHFIDALGDRAHPLDKQSCDGFVRDIVSIAYDVKNWSENLLGTMNAARTFREQERQH